MEKIRVGVLGLGRSGYGIHCKAFEKLSDSYELVAVADINGVRAAETGAELGVTAVNSVEELVAIPEIELVVVSSYNRDHAKNAVTALEHGKHVVCEKPFGLSVAEVDAMLAAAKAAGKFVVPFQNRRYEDSYVKVKEILASGVLGKVVHIRIAQHGFGRRWDWQTLSEFGGGQLHNNGPHILDQALGLYEACGVDDVESLEVWSDLRATLSSGDTADHARATLRHPDAFTLDIEFAATCPYGQDKWLVMATSGGLRGTSNKLEWKWVDWSAHPERPVQCASTPDRSYNREDLVWQSANYDCTESFERLQGSFYTDLWHSVREGAPLSVTPESVRKRIRLLERIRG
ncbi:Gfo/Idh/MocA family oxidoreductase [Armatimonas sp.]|uniref:Gfo/Idh/MocA family protein n=1 Tax=Armatimonas sp. TaxID=1872638 RepID=UPI00286A379F|nr:Gfo/Idh/MocA family oxidoreductase [Armatimonas sp.]